MRDWLAILEKTGTAPEFKARLTIKGYEDFVVKANQTPSYEKLSESKKQAVLIKARKSIYEQLERSIIILEWPAS